MMDAGPSQFGLYIHWPFCQSKCPYCDFNSHVAASIDQNRWGRAYLAEIDRVGLETPDRLLHTVFFGGGTPSLMDPSLVTAILDRVRATWRVANDWEVTLEANPGSVEAARFAGYRDAGVNRISMGIQALNDIDLRRLGRLHSAADARAAFDVARNLFDRVSFDLIYARQDQPLAVWEGELRSALTMAIDHLSLYQLTIEDGTAFGDRHRMGGLKGLPDEDLSADMFTHTRDVCADMGFPAYEVSNHARTGAQSQHNLIYWRGGDYLGIGPGAHGRMTVHGARIATTAHRTPGAWLEHVETLGSGEEPRQTLTAADKAAEYVMMGMRLTEGILIAPVIDQITRHQVTTLAEQGLVWTDKDRIGATASGTMVLNHVIRKLLVG
jgi:putative oxygen-independent coproporphyrinogen III oxidase